MREQNSKACTAGRGRRGGRLRALAATLGASVVGLVAMAAPATASAAFELSGFTDVYQDAEGNPVTEAGAHPFTITNTIEVKNKPGVELSGLLKEAVVETPLGFVGDPSEIPTCEAVQLATETCPVASRIGTLYLNFGLGAIPNFVYNMVPPEGQPAQFGASVIGATLNFFDASVRPSDNGINVTSSDIPHMVSIAKTELELWGVPADPAHDAGRSGNPLAPEEASAGVEPRAFLTMPTSCDKPMVTRVRASSWEEPNNYVTAEYVGEQMEGCETTEFDYVDTKVQPTSDEADVPSGYEIEVTQRLRETPKTNATSLLKDAIVTLPEGVTVNPSAADGLEGCTEEQLGLVEAGEVDCPTSSRIGNVRIDTPLINQPLTGAVYQAAQEDNPFGSLLSIYMVAENERYGQRIKLAGEVSADPETGRLTTTFLDNPQLPFSKLTLNLRGGPRAVLVNPPTCGEKTSEWTLTPYARPNDGVSGTDTFRINEGPGGSACPAGGSGRDFDPGMEAGTENPIAGAHSTFAMRLTRGDGQQTLNRIDATLPPGMLAKVAGVPYCPEGALDEVTGDPNTAAGTASEEISDPACPEDSMIGRVTVGAGAGANPFYIQSGKAYLAGPYKGSPLSIAFVVPALAGPLDLGTITVRAGVDLDPRTAQLSVASDDIPEIAEGIPLRIRDLRLIMDRPEFMLNPTSCAPMSVDADVRGGNGAEANLSDRFQVGGCAALGFGPRIAFRTYGGVKRGAYQGLRAVVKTRPGESNMRRVAVRMPRTAFLAQEHLSNICTRVQFAAEECPEDSVYGRAIAYSPLLGYPLRGNVYLRSSDDQLPNLVADLRGPDYQPIRIELVGRIDSVKGALRNTFDVVPDAPVSFFRLQLAGGEKGLIVNSTNVCRGVQRAAARFVGHSGKAQIRRPALRNARCGQRRKARQARRAAARAQAERVQVSAARSVR